MPNSIASAELYSGQLLDETFKQASVTNLLLANNVKFEGVKTVRIPKITLSGLGKYSRTNGYPNGSVSYEYETLEMGQDRGISYSIDNLDNQEAQDRAFADTTSQAERLEVAPEVDAYRVKKCVDNAGKVVAGGTLTKANAITNLEAGITELNNNEVPLANCVIFVSPEFNSLIRLNTEVNRFFTETKDVDNSVWSYNGMPIIMVPKKRFYTDYTFSDTDGFEETETAKEINFMIVCKDSALAVVKHMDAKIITPELNQTADAYKYMIHLYHELFVPDNKKAGIYVNTK